MDEKFLYCVITDAGDSNGGCADDLALPDPDRTDGIWPAYTTEFESGRINEETSKALITVRTPVFSVGELLILNKWGREVCGAGRKPSKWHIGYEVYEDFADALLRAQEVSRVWTFRDPFPPPAKPPVESQTAEDRKARTEMLCEAIRNSLPAQPPVG